MSVRGRPTTFNEVLAEKAIQALRKGLSRWTTSNLIGKSKEVVDYWITQGLAGNETYSAFSERALRAESEFTEELHKIIRATVIEQKTPSVENAKWLLERRRSKDYVVQKEVAQYTDSTVEVSQASDDELIAAMESEIKEWKLKKPA